MKMNRVISPLLVAGCCLASSSAFAATCNATQGSIAAPPATPVTIQGNNCGNNSNFQGASFCGGVAFSNTGTDAYQVTLGAGQNFSFTVTSPGSPATPPGSAFTPDIALVSTNCTDNATCIKENTTGTTTVTNPQSGTISGKAAGTYFIYVTDSDGGTGTGNECGDYSLSFTGVLPVKLQNFSVQ